ncbi:MAG: glycosyltransferase family 2 protein [Planctomycetota bacterium]
MPAFTTDLVVPAYNEAENIDPLFDALRPVVGDGRPIRRVVLADNRSTDGTGERAAARGARVVREERPGYGAACLAAIAEARRADAPDAIAFLDADLSDDPAELPGLLAPLIDRSADLVIGQRLARAEPGALEPHQRFGNWLACALIARSTGRRYRDLGPMRALTVDALDRLGMADTTWGWTVEMQFKAVTRGLRVTEIDVPYRKRHAGRSKISGSIVGSYKAGTKIIGTIAQLRRSESGSSADPRR